MDDKVELPSTFDADLQALPKDNKMMGELLTDAAPWVLQLARARMKGRSVRGMEPEDVSQDILLKLPPILLKVLPKNQGHFKRLVNKKFSEYLTDLCAKKRGPMSISGLALDLEQAATTRPEDDLVSQEFFNSLPDDAREVADRLLQPHPAPEIAQEPQVESKGATNRRIAAELDLSTRTIEKRRSEIAAHLGYRKKHRDNIDRRIKYFQHTEANPEQFAPEVQDHQVAELLHAEVDEVGVDALDDSMGAVARVDIWQVGRVDDTAASVQHRDRPTARHPLHPAQKKRCGYGRLVDLGAQMERLHQLVEMDAADVLADDEERSDFAQIGDVELRRDREWRRYFDQAAAQARQLQGPESGSQSRRLRHRLAAATVAGTFPMRVRMESVFSTSLADMQERCLKGSEVGGHCRIRDPDNLPREWRAESTILCIFQ